MKIWVWATSLVTWIFIAHKVGYFLLSAFGLHHHDPWLNELVPLFEPSPAPSTVFFSRWKPRCCHQEMIPQVLACRGWLEFGYGRGIKPVVDTGFFVCWTGGWIKYIQIHSKTDVHLVYIFGGATLVRALLVFMKKRITWAVAKTHPRLHYDVGLLKKHTVCSTIIVGFEVTVKCNSSPKQQFN